MPGSPVPIWATVAPLVVAEELGAQGKRAKKGKERMSKGEGESMQGT